MPGGQRHCREVLLNAAGHTVDEGRERDCSIGAE